MSHAPVPANEYHDNLADSRHPGGAQPYSVATPEVRQIARALIDDKDYRESLQQRLRDGTAGAIEIWLWRWAHGNPQDAVSATGEKDRQRYGELRSIVVALIRDNPRAAAQLEEKILAHPGLPAAPSPEDDREEEGTA